MYFVTTLHNLHVTTGSPTLFTTNHSSPPALQKTSKQDVAVISEVGKVLHVGNTDVDVIKRIKYPDEIKKPKKQTCMYSSFLPLLCAGLCAK